MPTRLTMLRLKRPAYRAALEGFLEFHRSVSVRLEEPALEAPLENLPRLYQVWGTLEVIAALLGVAVELGYLIEEQRLVTRDPTGVDPAYYCSVRDDVRGRRRGAELRHRTADPPRLPLVGRTRYALDLAEEGRGWLRTLFGRGAAPAHRAAPVGTPL